MSAVEVALATWLPKQAAFSALCGSRCYTGTLPQEIEKPAVAIRVLGGSRLRAHDGYVGAYSPTLELMVVADSRADAFAVARALRALLENHSGSTEGVTIDAVLWGDTEQDIYDEPVNEWRVPCEATVVHTEA